MQKLLIFFLATFVAAAQAECTFNLENDTNDFIWLIAQDWGNKPLLLSSKEWKGFKASANQSRLNPQANSEIDSKQVTVPEDAPLYVYVEERSSGGTPATGGRVGGTFYQAIATKVYEITNNSAACPMGTVKYSNMIANEVPGLTAKKK
jgi:hypothetical protein